jgi:hypothetical protein
MMMVGCRPFPRTSALVVLLTALGATVSCRQIAGLHPIPMPCSDPLMIDDMEDGNSTICDSGKRHGTWYSFGDGTSGTQTMAPNAAIPGGRGSSQRALEFSGSGFTGWGAITGFNFDDQGLGRQAYDASSTGGLTFWMKSTAPVTVEVLLPATVPVAEDGQCGAGTAPGNCNNHFSFRITPPDSTWTQYQVPFTALRQLRTGTATWDPTHLLGVQFDVDPGASFDVWIDDIAFYYCSTSECVPTCTDPKLPVACDAKGAHPAGCYLPGTDCGAITTWCADPLLIDDMEDGDNDVCASGGRLGTWWTASDGTVGATLTPAVGTVFTQTPIPGGRGQSLAAARLAGSGFTSWGAAMGFALAGGDGQPYDASAVDGISFWMKTDADGIDFETGTPETTPAAQGGTCTDSSTAVNCDTSFAFRVEAPASDTWFQVSVPFAALTQNPGTWLTTGNLTPGSAAWDPSKLVRVGFAVEGLDPFELWIDDVAFYSCGASPCVPTCTGPAFPVACPAATGQPAGCWPAGTDCANRQPRPWQNLGVWGSGPNDVWVVGLSRDNGFGGTAFHWDGAAWRRGDVGTVPPLVAVSGQGADDVWAVGDHGGVARWNGSIWLSSTAGTDASLSTAWVGGPEDVWTAAYPGTLLHWDGSGWSTAFSVDEYIYGLWGTAPNDVWAVGDGGTILHYDGTAWSAVPSTTTVFLNRVWGSGPSDVWAVGDSGPILHFDGSTWAPSPGVTGGFLGVWASGPADAWAVGYGGAIVHWNGAAWSAVASPARSDLYVVWGSGPTDVWAAGTMPTVLHFDGTTWSSVNLVGQTP